MIKPLPGYVLIEPIEDEERSAGGVYLPESSKDKPCRGKIVNVCTFYVTEPLSVIALNKEGQDFINEQWKKDPTMGNTLISVAYQDVAIGKTVIYKKWTNQEVQHEGKTYLLVAFSELLGIIE